MAKIMPFRKPRRLTPEIVGELLRIHGSCVHDQAGKCPLLVSVSSLTKGSAICRLFAELSPRDRGWLVSVFFRDSRSLVAAHAGTIGSRTWS